MHNKDSADKSALFGSPSDVFASAAGALNGILSLYCDITSSSWSPVLWSHQCDHGDFSEKNQAPSGLCVSESPPDEAGIQKHSYEVKENKKLRRSKMGMKIIQASPSTDLSNFYFCLNLEISGGGESLANT